MVKHIGIVGCSAEGAALCYRTICREGADLLGEHNHPEISMHTHPLAAYTPFFPAGAWDRVGELMLSSTRKLQAAGADFCICPDNTIHQAYDYVLQKSPLPWLHIADAIAEEAARNGYSKLAITGTRFLMEGPVYPEKLKERGIAHQIPDPAERDEINRIIFTELVYSIITPPSTAYFVQAIQRMKTAGCDAVVLGCTEIPLMITPANSPLPVLDSTRLLARTALRHAVEE